MISPDLPNKCSCLTNTILEPHQNDGIHSKLRLSNQLGHSSPASWHSPHRPGAGATKARDQELWWTLRFSTSTACASGLEYTTEAMQCCSNHAGLLAHPPHG